MNATQNETDITTAPPNDVTTPQGHDQTHPTKSNVALTVSFGLGIGFLIVAIGIVALLVVWVCRKKRTVASETQTENAATHNEVRDSQSFWRRENKRFVWSFKRKADKRNKDTTALVVYDVPPRNPVPVTNIVPGSSTYDHPPRNPVPVGGTTNEYPTYDYPRGKPVPVGDTTAGYSLYDYPRGQPVPVGNTTPGHRTQDRPRNVAIAAEEPMYVNMQGYVNAVEEPVYANT